MTIDIDDKIKTNDAILINKGWGRKQDGVGEFFAYHLNQEFLNQRIKVDTVKLLFIEKNKKLSRHYHLEKSEFFIGVVGRFLIEIWYSENHKEEFVLLPEERIFVSKGIQHRMTGLDEQNTLLEVSTVDSPEDSYRIEKGD